MVACGWWECRVDDDDEWGGGRPQDPLRGQLGPPGGGRADLAGGVGLQILPLYSKVSDKLAHVPQVTDELIMALFNQIGPVKGCKIIREPGTSLHHPAP